MIPAIISSSISSLYATAWPSAGLGSLYICADHFQYRRGGLRREESGAPAALQRVRKAPTTPQPVARAVVTRVDLARLGEALDRGDKWMQDNYKIDPPAIRALLLVCVRTLSEFS